ncbi:serine/threonine-protein kinase [Aphanothece sacrum]|uniref:non-specific serine/threonine protein kinase n=1 Tax=Aphanothece sacrum FPU1 TaxID=1920663 RepID=A0A401IN55_APHSA|nr:serine/threonine-protein kinase [Aphanothece sacrum]GBF82666.1 serine/threonine protein kinase [Aphanothece sacrum FPU1]GBF84542.1 serine/threonine protein kinase [Aphanothece sacrum FPU3]
MTILLLNNRYKILETLGKGGFGETFLAIDTHLPSQRKCVIKKLKPALQSPEIPGWLKERFGREAAILEQLGANHPQIPGLYAYFEEKGDFFLVQEWIEGETLTQIHKRRGNLSEKDVKEILMGILPILDFIHHQRIIHRDIKPDNVIIRATDVKPVLIDFGIVKEAVATIVATDGHSAYSVALGTPGYMSSEQAAGRPVYSSDMYSLGLTAIFLLTGKTPQYLDTDLQTGEILWRKEVPSLNSNLGTVIDCAIRFHPRDRFPSAQKMLEALLASAPIATAATLVVAPHQLSLQTPELTETITSEEKDTPWPLLILASFLVASAIFGGLTLGVILANKNRSRPSPSPQEVIESPTPQTFPKVESPEPTVQPRQRRPVNQFPNSNITPTPEVETTPTPQPETTPTPEVETTPTPEVETTPTPEVETTPTPEVETTPTPEVETTPTPQPETTPTPVQPSSTSHPPSTPVQPPSPTIPNNNGT